MSIKWNEWNKCVLCACVRVCIWSMINNNGSIGCGRNKINDFCNPNAIFSSSIPFSRSSFIFTIIKSTKVDRISIYYKYIIKTRRTSYIVCDLIRNCREKQTEMKIDTHKRTRSDRYWLAGFSFTTKSNQIKHFSFLFSMNEKSHRQNQCDRSIEVKTVRKERTNEKKRLVN